MRPAVIEKIYLENQGYIATVARRYSSFLGDGFEDLFQELSVELVAQLKRATGKHRTLNEIQWACKRTISRLLRDHYSRRLPVVEPRSAVEMEDPAYFNAEGKVYDHIQSEELVPDWCSVSYPGLATALAEGLTVPQIAIQLKISRAEVRTVLRKLREMYVRDGIRG